MRKTSFQRVLPAALAAAVCAAPGQAAPVEREMTLAEVLKLAVAAPDSVQTRLQEGRARADVLEAEWATKPYFRIDVRGNVRTGNNAGQVGEDEIGFAKSALRTGLYFAYSLYDGGKRKSLVRSARATYKSTEAATRSQQLELLLLTSGAFHAVARQQQLLDTGEAAVAVAREGLRDAQGRLDAGAATKGEVLTAQSSVSALAADFAGAKGLLGRSRAHLAGLLGMDPASIAPVAKEDATLPALADGLDALVSKAVRFSPQRESLEADKEAQEQLLRAIRADFKPNAGARASAGGLLDNHNNIDPYGVLSFGVSFPLSDRARVRARVDKQKLAVEDRDMELKKLARDVTEQVVSAWTDLQAVQSRLDAASAQETSAAEALRLARERYQVGVGTQQEVLTAQNLLVTARYSAATDRLDRATATQTLRLLTGQLGDLQLGFPPAPWAPK